MRIRFPVLSLCLLSLAACGGSSDNGGASPGDEQDVVAPGGTIYASAGAGLTGGTLVRALNAPTTRCADGKRASACTVLGADFTGLKLSDPQTKALAKGFTDGHVIAKGKLTSETLKDPSGITITKLVVTEAWVGQSGNALKDGDSVFLVSNKILNGFCTGGCGALRQTTVNTSQLVDIGKVDFGAVHVESARLNDINADMQIGGPGALIAGVDHALGGKGPEAPTLFASEIYLHAGALSGQACSDDVATQARCAPGLECVFLEGGPISEHTAGTCNRLVN
jgi:Domain of unknown function (DUF6748)